MRRVHTDIRESVVADEIALVSHTQPNADVMARLSPPSATLPASESVMDASFPPPAWSDATRSRHAEDDNIAAHTNGYTFATSKARPALNREENSRSRLLDRGQASTHSRLPASAHFDDNDEAHQDSSDTEADDQDEHMHQQLTPLDIALEEIGMGKYQKTLLVLCGFGWMADNMWLQCIAVILPRVQEHFGVSDRWIGSLSASLFAGMMVGAWGWGSYSDAQGRTPAFNFTLLLTSLFGVGGSMPTDGTLFLENVPRSSHYLLTALSAFFSLGAVLTSLLGLVIIPTFSCPENPADEQPCDVATQNQGWRYMLIALSIVSVTMCLSRVVLFRLQESPKFLTAVQRQSEAVVALEMISRINGDSRSWDLRDVVDHVEGSHGMQTARKSSSRTVDEYEALDEAVTGNLPTTEANGIATTDYDSMSELNFALDDDRRGEDGHFPKDADDRSLGTNSPRDGTAIALPTFARKRAVRKVARARPAWAERLPDFMASGVDEYLSRLEELFDHKWKRTTILVWLIWLLASAGYTIFNVFLPKYLEEKVGETVTHGGREQSLREYVLYTAAGIPGSLLGAWLVETSLGRIKTLAISTLVTSASTLVFVFVQTQAGIMASSAAVSLAATLMYAVIYAYTPEAFPTTTRQRDGLWHRISVV
ncbi:hypothetical protein OIV83_001972 [Microbotryomycetes sp. JL201]|nr:hypothetical protein OIV83_001972 [Microbotryomycetes sp. JL201]